MKFTNGYWLMRDGVDALFARDAYELHPDPAQETISVLAPTRPIAERANTLNQPAFHVELSTPIEGVIRVRATHWRGGPQGIGFPIAQDEPGGRNYVHITTHGDGDGETGERGATAALSSGGLTATVVKGPEWNLMFTDERGNALTRSQGKSLARFALNELANVSAEPVGEFGVTRTGLANA